MGDTYRIRFWPGDGGSRITLHCQQVLPWTGCRVRGKGLGCRTVIGKTEINPSLSVASLIPTIPGKAHLLSGWEQVPTSRPLISEGCRWAASTQQVWWAEGRRWQSPEHKRSSSDRVVLAQNKGQWGRMFPYKLVSLRISPIILNTTFLWYSKSY